MGLSTTIAGYLLLFTLGGFGFVLLNLVLGSFLRPSNPDPEKLEIYECGEPTIGSSFVQFDLRFYVVALLFIIFEVEVAFFFPWGVVFGKATQLAQAEGSAVVETETGQRVLGPEYYGLMRELGLPADADPQIDGDPSVVQRDLKGAAAKLVWTCLADIALFFSVLLVGFAYVWKRGDLDWVRSMKGTAHRQTSSTASWQKSSQAAPLP